MFKSSKTLKPPKIKSRVALNREKFLEALEECSTPSRFAKVLGLSEIEININISDEIFDYNMIAGLDLSSTDRCRINVEYADFTASVSIMEQPYCCANLFIYNLEVDPGLQPKVAFIILLKLCEIIGRYRGYTFMWFTQIEGEPSTAIARKYGFKISREYINRRTDEDLVDLYFEIPE